MNKMKTLLFITHTMDHSGAPTSLLNIIKKFPKDKYEICLIGMYGGGLKKEYQKYLKKIYVIIDNVNSSVFLKVFNKFIGFIKLLFLFIKIKPDVVLINSSANLRAILVSRLMNKHTLVYVREFDEMINKVKNLRKKSLKLATKLIAVSHANKEWLYEIGISPEKIIVIHNGIDFDEVYKKTKELPSQEYLEFINGYRIIGIVGYMSERKGIDFFIELMINLSKRYMDLKFVIIGDFTDESYKNKILTIIKNEKLEDKLFITGIVDNIFPYLKYIDIVTMMSRKESLPRVILESSVIAKPIVIFDTGGSKELLPIDYKFIVKAFDIFLFQSYVEELLNNKQEAINIGLGLKKFSKKFAIEQTVNSLISELESI